MQENLAIDRGKVEREKGKQSRVIFHHHSPSFELQEFDTLSTLSWLLSYVY